MAAIPNIKRELFARCIAAGKHTQLECYVQAGFTNTVSENGSNSGVGGASTLAREPLVVERIQELIELREDRGAIPDNELDLEEIVSTEHLTEDWVLRQLQDLIRAAKSVGQLKVARDSLIDIANIRGIGVKTTSGEDRKNDALPNSGKVNITFIAAKLAEAGGTLNQLLDEAIDITEKPQLVPRVFDRHERSSPDPISDTITTSGDGE